MVIMIWNVSRLLTLTHWQISENVVHRPLKVITVLTERKAYLCENTLTLWEAQGSGVFEVLNWCARRHLFEPLFFCSKPNKSNQHCKLLNLSVKLMSLSMVTGNLLKTMQGRSQNFWYSEDAGAFRYITIKCYQPSIPQKSERSLTC